MTKVIISSHVGVEGLSIAKAETWNWEQKYPKQYPPTISLEQIMNTIDPKLKYPQAFIEMAEQLAAM